MAYWFLPYLPNFSLYLHINLIVMGIIIICVVSCTVGFFIDKRYSRKKLKNIVNITMPIYGIEGNLLDTLHKQEIVQNELR